MVEGFVHDVIGPLPPGAVLFSDMWETLEAPDYYFKEVEGFRRDVTFVGPELSRRGWYLDELARREPALIARSGSAFITYRAALRALEQRQVGTLPQLEQARLEWLDACVAGCLRDHVPVFSTGTIRNLDPAWRRVPWHLTNWWRADTTYVPEPEWPRVFRPWPNHADVYIAGTYQFYAEARLARSRYEARHGESDKARLCFEQALECDPHIRPESVGPLPLGFDQLVLGTIHYFHNLHALAPPLPPG
jgi:hypothetical protein